jgi:hypothetical protein
MSSDDYSSSNWNFIIGRREETTTENTKPPPVSRGILVLGGGRGRK